MTITEFIAENRGQKKFVSQRPVYIDNYKKITKYNYRAIDLNSLNRQNARLCPLVIGLS